jgi:molecular chaperone DnaK (HSP70)
VVCDEVLARAGWRVSDVEHLVISGGTTYMPAVRKAISSYFGRELAQTAPPDQLVAMGAAFSARCRQVPALAAAAPFV